MDNTTAKYEERRLTIELGSSCFYRQLPQPLQHKKRQWLWQLPNHIYLKLQDKEDNVLTTITHTHNHIYMLVLFFEGCSAASQGWGLTSPLLEKVVVVLYLRLGLHPNPDERVRQRYHSPGQGDNGGWSCRVASVMPNALVCHWGGLKNVDVLKPCGLFQQWRASPQGKHQSAGCFLRWPNIRSPWPSTSPRPDAASWSRTPLVILPLPLPHSECQQSP